MTGAPRLTVAVHDLDLSAALRPPDADHVRALAGVIGRVPPILVQRGTHRVLDGHMRVLAARAAGLAELPVEWIDDATVGWLRAVEANTSHGLPMTVRQRSAVARQVLAVRPEWSNRRIAKLCGVDEATVRRARPDHPGAETPQLDARVGLDGSRHPIDRQAQRDAARRALVQDSGLSNAAVARQVGLSPTTVAAVRRDLALPKPTEADAPRRPVPPMSRMPRRRLLQAVLRFVRRVLRRLVRRG